jgi:hypothetical protein
MITTSIIYLPTKYTIRVKCNHKIANSDIFSSSVPTLGGVFEL